MSRTYAKPKALGLFDRIANASHAAMRGSAWTRLDACPVGAHIIANERRAFQRRASAWSRKVVRVTFAGRS